MKDSEDKRPTPQGGPARADRPLDLPPALDEALLPEAQKLVGELQAQQLELEHRVLERTATLYAMLDELRSEIVHRKQIEQALRRSEDRLRLLTDALPVCMSYVDTQLRYQYINATYEKWFGVRREDIQGKYIWDIIGQAAYQLVRPHLVDVLAGKETTYERLLPYQHGPTRHVHITLVPDRGEDGQVLGIHALVSDITQRKEAEEIARKHLEALAHFGRVSTMGEMASGLAHELNQPLTALTLQAEAADRMLASLSPETTAALSTSLREIGEQAHRASNIIGLLRRLVGRSQPRRSTLDINELIHDVVKLVASELRNEGITLQLQLAPDMPLLLADRIQIEQVLINLIRNSIEALKKSSSGELSILVTTTKRPGGTVEVSVLDTGCGFGEVGVQRIFEGFFSTKHDGMGMGLSIGRSIIEAHGGRLWAEPNPAGGAVLRFQLPVRGEAERS